LKIAVTRLSPPPGAAILLQQASFALNLKTRLIMNYFKLLFSGILLACFTLVKAQEASTVFVRSFNENLYEIRMTDDFQNNRIVAAQWAVGSGQGVSNPNVFIEKYNSQNAMQWGMSTLYEFGAVQATLVDVAVDEGGAVYVLINYQGGTAELNGVSFEGTVENENDFFLAKISPSGSVQWVIGPDFGDFPEKDRTARSLSINSENEILICGDHHRDFSMGGTLVEGAASDAEDSQFEYPMSFVVKLDHEGNGIMSQSFNKIDNLSVTGSQGPQDVLQAPDGTIFTLLNLSGAVELNGDTINPNSSEGELTKAILKTDENFGNPTVLMLHSPESFGFQISEFILDQCGEPVIGGTYSEYLDMGGEEISTTTGTRDIFVARLSIENEVQWLQGFGTSFSDNFRGLDVNDQNEVFFSMEYSGEFTYSDEPYTPEGGDAAIFKLDSQGEFIWEVHTTGPAPVQSYDLAVMPDNTIGMVNTLNGSENIGGASLQSDGRMVLSTWIANEHSGEPVDCSGVISVEEPKINETELAIYPNPAQDFITVEFRGKKSEDNQVVVFNSSGQRVLTKNLNNSKKLDVSTLPSGLYMLKVEGIQNPAKRFIKR
jgi:hypothetical protein